MCEHQLRSYAIRQAQVRNDTDGGLYSYNRYLAVASRVVRRSLKEDQRLKAERRGEMDLRFAKWEVSAPGADTDPSDMERETETKRRAIKER